MHCVVISLQATIQPRYVWLIYMTRSFFCRGAWILESYWSISWLTMSIYTLCTIWLFNSSPWKTIIFKNGKPSISMGRLYHGYVSHNQRVNPISSHDSSLLTHCYSPLKITIKSPFIVVKSPLSYGFPMVFLWFSAVEDPAVLIDLIRSCWNSKATVAVWSRAGALGPCFGSTWGYKDKS